MSQAFVLTEEEVLALPVDELALEILRDIAANREWNSGNWMVQAQHGYSKVAIDALNEAWQWLHSSGLVAESLDKNNSLHAIIVTRSGHRAASAGLAEAKAAQRLSVDLHPALETRIRRQYLMGEFELSAFAAMKAVEVRVRQMAGVAESLIGIKLMRHSFGDGGRLRDLSLDPGEQVARMELFAGAIGVFKNPTSHRDVQYDNPTEAAEVILLADLLMRMLDRIESDKEP